MSWAYRTAAPYLTCPVRVVHAGSRWPFLRARPVLQPETRPAALQKRGPAGTRSAGVPLSRPYFLRGPSSEAVVAAFSMHVMSGG